MHSVYFKYRVVGEWFNFTNEIKNEVFKLFKPINEKNNNYILNDYFMNDFAILNEFVILEQEKNYKAISNLSSLVFNKIGPKNFKNLLVENNEIKRIVESAIYMNL